MTDWLVKIFIKEYNDIGNQKVRTQYGILASVVGIICNLILFLVKIIIGIVIHSVSILADAFNNLSDAASCIISFVGVKLANRPADKEHPFGHGRYEYIAAFVVSFLILQVGFTCLKSSIDKIIHPEVVSTKPVLLVILGISILLKVWMGFFNRTLGERIQSSVMKATAADAFGDVLITSVTLISLIVGSVTGWKIDGYMGVVVSIFVLLAGFHIAKDTIEPLLGEATTQEDYNRITQFVESYEGIIGSHDLIVHNYGPSHIMASIHGEVPRNVDIEIAHELIDRIERDAQKELGIFLIIHMDPIAIDDEKNIELRTLVQNIVSEIESTSSIHDFRMVNGEKQINLIFDLIVPYSYTEKEQSNIMLEIMERVSQIDKRYQCVITVEHGYIAQNEEEKKDVSKTNN